MAKPTSLQVIWAKVANILQIAHAAVVCILGVVQFLRQSFQMYRVTKRWQINRYMSLLVKQGIIYIFVYVPVSSLSSTAI